jgi:hypothetical protein
MSAALIFGVPAGQTRHYPINGALGTNFYHRSEVQDHDLGTTQLGSGNTVWMFVKAVAAGVPVGDCSVNADGEVLTAGGAYDNPVAFKIGQCGWVRKDGSAF